MGFILFFIVALFFSMAGLGGGSVYVPFFTFIGYDIKSVAIPGGIILVFTTALSSSINYMRNRQVNYPMALALLSGSLIVSFLGYYFFFNVASNRTLLGILIISIMLSGARMLFIKAPVQSFVFSEKTNYMIGFCTGFIVGFVSVMTGVGGGFLMIPVLLQLGYTVKTTVGTSSFVILFTSMAGGIIHLSQNFNFVHLNELLIFVAVVFAGAWIGSKIHIKLLKEKHVRLLMGIVLLGLGIYLLIVHFF
jgi:hypothetical protein